MPAVCSSTSNSVDATLWKEMVTSWHVLNRQKGIVRGSGKHDKILKVSSFGLLIPNTVDSVIIWSIVVGSRGCRLNDESRM
jgi:hypothetical protein